LAYDATLAARVRAILHSRRDVVEQKMMGGLCFMVGGNMCCGVTGTALMVRVGAEAYQQALAEPHVRPLEFGGRRPKAFVLVDAEGVRTKATLERWIRRGLTFVATLPAK
jgi:hypothetical protein